MLRFHMPVFLFSIWATQQAHQEIRQVLVPSFSEGVQTGSVLPKLEKGMKVPLFRLTVEHSISQWWVFQLSGVCCDSKGPGCQYCPPTH